MKRLLDILLSFTALLFLSPLLLPIAIILKCTGEGYIFYKQERVGKDGKMFGLLKFATMLKDSPNMNGGLLTKNKDPRVLPFGRFLRATKINELPQLINVLLGDMSLIGPRPQAQPHFDVFPKHVKEEIIKVRPGLSGIGSIMFRDEDNILTNCGTDEHKFYANDIAPYKGELEIWYVNNCSVVLDVKLILTTVLVVLFSNTRKHLDLFHDLPKPKSPILAKYLGHEIKQVEDETCKTVKLGTLNRMNKSLDRAIEIMQAEKNSRTVGRSDSQTEKKVGT